MIVSVVSKQSATAIASGNNTDLASTWGKSEKPDSPYKAAVQLVCERLIDLHHASRALDKLNEESTETGIELEPLTRMKLHFAPKDERELGVISCLYDAVLAGYFPKDRVPSK
jgi:hypothetical protein